MFNLTGFYRTSLAIMGLPVNCVFGAVQLSFQDQDIIFSHNIFDMCRAVYKKIRKIFRLKTQGDRE